MVRLRNHIEPVLAWSMQRHHRDDGPNPAQWRGNLDAALPHPLAPNRRQHSEAVPIDEVHALVLRLRQVEGPSARALEYSIWTASRTGVVRTAEWGEPDVHAKTCTIPGQKMNSGRPYRAPLPKRAIGILEALPRFDGVPLVFPGSKGMALSDMAFMATIRRMGVTAAPHGFRSTTAKSPDEGPLGKPCGACDN
jgi:integrase